MASFTTPIAYCWDISRQRPFYYPAAVACDWIRRQGKEKIYYIGCENALPDFESLIVASQGKVDFVVVGDLFDCYSREALEGAANAIWDGAELIALQNKRTWVDGNSRHVDNGFWVAGLSL